MKKRLKHIAVCLAAALAFSGCTAPQALNKNNNNPSKEPEVSAASDKIGAFKAPPLTESVFNSSAAAGENGVLIDLSSAGNGYVGISAVSEKRLKVKIIKDGVEYTYNLPQDGAETFYPFSMGNGSYEIKVLQNTTESKYLPICTQTAQVNLSTEFEPFVRPSQYCNYNASSECVKKAAELVKSADTDAEAAALIYAYIKDNILYDKEKAEAAVKNYVPTPDETLATNKGICFDYASLAAAMLRSQGIPTKIITGNVAPNDLFHAWNMIWLEESGWIEVKIEIPGKSWERIDLTFAAGGAGSEFVGDGKNYTDMFVY